MKILIVAADIPMLNAELSMMRAKMPDVEIITVDQAKERGLDPKDFPEVRHFERPIPLLKAADDIYFPDTNEGPIGAITPKRRGKRNYR